MRQLAGEVAEQLTPASVRTLVAAVSGPEGRVARRLHASARGEDRALVDGLWVEVPTYRNAQRTLERARRLAGPLS